VLGHELGVPDGVNDLLLRRQLAGFEGETGEDVHGPRAQLDGLITLRDPVEHRLDQPIAELEGVAHRHRAVVLFRHTEKRVVLQDVDSKSGRGISVARRRVSARGMRRT